MATEIEFHCTDCGACPDEPCRDSLGQTVPPHRARRTAAEPGEAWADRKDWS